MRIFIPYQIEAIGGPMSFVRLLANELTRRGHTVTFTFTSDFEVLLVVSACPLAYVLYAKLTHKKVIQRLDGVYHPGIPGLNGYLYWWKNLVPQIIHNYLADTVIYQSQFSQESCEKYLGHRRQQSHSEIIYNGVTLPVANPLSYKVSSQSSELQSSPPAPAKPVRLLAFANWRRRDQIVPLLQALKYLPNPEAYQLTIYGPHTPALAKYFTTVQKVGVPVAYQGALPHSELLTKLAEHDIFLFADQSACPNSVLEALAAGLPVVAYSRGAIPELVQSGRTGEVVPLPPHNPYSERYPFTKQSYDQFAQAIQKVAGSTAEYSRQARQVAASRFSITQAADQYCRILEKLL